MKIGIYPVFLKSSLVIAARKGGFFQGRYYQDTAVTRVLDAIANGRDRILLTLATGTGKTFIAFQLSWKLRAAHTDA